MVFCTLSLALLSVPTLAAENVTLDMFYGIGCPHCAAAEPVIEQFEAKYPSLHVNRYEVYENQTNRDLLVARATALGQDVGGIPTFFLNDTMVVGYSDAIGADLELTIAACAANGGCNGSTGDKPAQLDLTLPMVIIAAPAVAINPCALAFLILLLSTIIARHDRKKALYAGIAFVAAIYLTFLFVGLGLLQFLSFLRTPWLTRGLMIFVSVLSLIIGALNIKDDFWFGKVTLMEVPRSWRPRVKQLIGKVASIPGAFLVGILVSLFLIPCASGPYLVILGKLNGVESRATGLMWLLLYNLIFILPMLILTILVAHGMVSTEKLEQTRQRRLKLIHLIVGIIMILLGIAMLGAIAIGAL
jgi:cytochrome c biogenesis protein CcdA